MHLSKQITILYGSEGGNSEEYARYLFHKLRYLLQIVDIFPMNAFSVRRLITETRILIVFCSTTGQGQLPRNATSFLRGLLRRNLPSDLLDHILLSSFGLGDSSYPRFNHASRKIHTRLVQLGCSEISPRCEADEMSPQGVDEYYKEWELQLINELPKYVNVCHIPPETLLPAANAVSIATVPSGSQTCLRSMPIKTNDSNLPAILQDNKKNTETLALLSRMQNCETLLEARVMSNNRVTASDHFQDVRHIVLETSEIKYSPGDAVSLYPSNNPSAVSSLFDLQPHLAELIDQLVHIEFRNSLIVPGGLVTNPHLTLRNLIQFHLDLSAVPTRSFFALLWHFAGSTNADEERERDKLREFSSLEYSQELYDYANRPRRLILETILEFSPTVKIPLEYVFDLFPIIRPRDYLIASAPHSNKIEILAAIVSYKTRIRRLRRGLCTLWLQNLPVNSSIVILISRIGFKTSTLTSPNFPIIIVAPGTGIAPGKALAEYVSETNPKLFNPTRPRVHLFYGCRGQNKDFLFPETWQELCKKGILQLYTCFSRDSLPQRPKYVQDCLFQVGEKIARLIYEDLAMVFVCGSSGKMPRQVRITFSEILQKHIGLNQTNSELYLLKMEDDGRYREDCW